MHFDLFKKKNESVQVLNGSTPPFPPSPSPALAKVSCQGGKQIRNKYIFDVFHSFYGKQKQKKGPVRRLKKGQRKKRKARILHWPFSWGGPKRGFPTMTTSTVTRQGGPQQYGEETVVELFNFQHTRLFFEGLVKVEKICWEKGQLNKKCLGGVAN